MYNLSVFKSSKPKRACYNSGIEGHFASECRKPKENMAFSEGAYSDNKDGDEQLNDTTCLMAIDSEENNVDELNEDECFNPGGEINVFENIEDDDYFPFIFSIRIFLSYLICPDVSPLLLFVGSEDTIFDPDTLIDSSPKFDFHLKEFSGELAHINPILLEIKEADFDLEEEIRFVENLLYDNLSPRPPEELNAEIADTIVESLSPSPIPVEDSDSLLDEIDLFLATDDLLPPNIESDGYDSEGDIHFLEELLVDDSIPIPENELSDFDHDNPLFPRPPPEPPDVEFFFDLEPEVISVVKNNVDELNEDECFNPGGEINVFENIEDDDYFPFIFSIRYHITNSQQNGFLPLDQSRLP
uniref:CCHC-type domain-containing protein n=1 Tax=Tanacetum cinerariifolium TaxID=118510 RepID=A0A6L2LC29_TANCI|nr:hypothetical protein [Tanacetum cinerariifolium]